MEPGTKLADAAAALRTRIDLKHFLHEHCGLSTAAAAAKVREIVSEAPASPDGEELTRAGLARAFRSSKEKREARIRFLSERVDVAAAKRESLSIPPPPREGGYTRDHHEEYWLPNIIERMAGELAEQLDACTTADELEAKLVRLDWDDGAIGEYIEEHAQPKQLRLTA